MFTIESIAMIKAVFAFCPLLAIELKATLNEKQIMIFIGARNLALAMLCHVKHHQTTYYCLPSKSIKLRAYMLSQYQLKPIFNQTLSTVLESSFA